MNKTLLAVAVAGMLTITGCSSTKTFGLAAPSDVSMAVKDQRISTDFKDEGVKIYYTITGRLDRIEVYGQAQTWKGDFRALAEADAMEKLVKFVHGKNVSTERRIQIMSRAIDQARDKTLNKFRTLDEEIIATDSKELESKSTSDDNTSRRTADMLDRTLVNTVTTISSRGRLTAVRKIKNEVRDNGKMYVAVYQWNEKDQASSQHIRNIMK